MCDPPRLSRRHALLIPLCFVFVLGCTSRVGGNADERAGRAGTVMARDRRGGPTDLVRGVVGGDPDDPDRGGIEVLVADGDRSKGRIVLRITEVLSQSDYSTEPSRAVRCYEYKI